MSVFLGPLIATLFLSLIGVGRVMWIFAGLYLLSAVLTWYLKLPAASRPTAAPSNAQ
jgi:hypothetical protein